VTQSHQRQVFISYSHDDDRWCRQLVEHLQPLSKAGRLDVWVDKQVAPGSKWQSDIEAAIDRAGVAVLLVSRTFLASPFITTVELPRVLARAQAGDIRVLWVHVKPSTYLAVPELRELQAAIDPGTPLALMSAAKAEQALVEICARVQEAVALDDGPAAPIGRQHLGQFPTPPVARPSGVPFSAGKPGRAELDVHLMPSGGASILVEYAHGASGILIDRAAVEHRTLDGRFAFGGQRGLKAIGALLDRGSNSDLMKDLRGPTAEAIGSILFDVLFPNEAVWRRVLQQVFPPSGSALPNPPRHPLTVRIRTDHPELGCLPWRLTSWLAERLVRSGWSFEVAGEAVPRARVALKVPCPLLVIAPEGPGQELETARHLSELRHLLEGIDASWTQPETFRIARTRQQIEECVSGMRPEVVHVLAPASSQDGHLALHVDGPGNVALVPLSDLRAWLSHHPPQLVSLVLRFQDERARPGANLLGQEIPCVVVSRTGAWHTREPDWSTAWLGHLFRHGGSPVTAVHHAEVPTGPDRELPVATSCLYTAFDEWTTDVPVPWRVDILDSLRLDRDRQRSMVGMYVGSLVNSPQQRVLAIIAYAAAGNLLDKLAGQLIEYVDDQTQIAGIRPCELQFPDAKGALFEALARELELWAKPDSGSLAQALRHLAPKRLGGKAPVLWLDWTARVRGELPLSTGQLQQYLTFCRDFLVKHCLPELRIVSYLALERASERQAGLNEAVARNHDLVTDRFRFHLLDPLGHVTAGELLTFLLETANTHCPPDLVRDAARVIHEATGGNYEQTVALIESAESGNWYQLVAGLRTPTGPEEDRQI
jgi:hypothetical protein